MGEKDRLGAVHSQSGQDCRALLSDYATAGFTAAIVQIAACHPFVNANRNSGPDYRGQDYSMLHGQIHSSRWPVKFKSSWKMLMKFR
jgi:hypothetical protein